MKTQTAVYLRVSTLDQEKGIQSQEKAIRDYLANHSLSDSKWYRDRLSGADLNRPAFEKLQRDIFKGKVKRNNKKAGGTLPTRFTPGFIQSADGRCSAIKEIKRRLELLKADCGCDSYQKELLVGRAIHISSLLETQELQSYEGKAIDHGSYTQMVNCLIGLLKSLGLNKSASKALDLQTYVEKREGKTK